MKTQTKTLVVTKENFSELMAGDKPLVLDFWAAWCGPCRAFAPIFEAAALRHPDVVFGKIDTEAQPELAAAFEVRAIPTLAVLREGAALLVQPGMVGAKALDEIVERAQAVDMLELRKKIAAAKAKQPTEREERV